MHKFTALLSLALILSVFIAGVNTATKEEWKKRTIYQLLTDRFSVGGPNGHECNNLSNYCGGTFNGIKSQLDYIQGMGFDAIWISPVVENTDGGYHGYWAKDIYKINPRFGTEDDLRSLVDECHKRDIWVMVDVVYNHVGPVDTDYNQIKDFNKPEHYHTKCQVTNFQDTGNMEYCRLSNLPDLNQNHPEVYKTLSDWTVWLVEKFNLDGLRIDTVAFVNREFWSALKKETLEGRLKDIYVVGEVFDGRSDFINQYGSIIGGVLNYPMYYTVQNVYGRSESMYQIRARMNEQDAVFSDAGALGTFIDNHDNNRFLNIQSDWKLFMNALTYTVFGRGIPIIYYGSEQLFNGAHDPFNRETLWNKFNTKSEMYQFISKLVKTRRNFIDNIASSKQVERYVNDKLYAFTRGQVFVATTNVGSFRDQRMEFDVTYHDYAEGTTLCNIFFENDCVQVQNNKFHIVLNYGESKVFVPRK
ncbi:alpha-amylase [Acrasis kona]|uniref:alpha-amylase n=1 Tax=Acrasis kona TaxID=1008807 RepID=A0AAW2ZDR3_9EUKA